MSKLAHSNDATMAIIATQNCPDCCGKSTVQMLGEEYPCPSCRGDDFENQCVERGIEPGLK